MRTKRSSVQTADGIEKLNRRLERLVEERTAALRDREAQLAEQNLLMDAALNNMSQGLLMFDAESRLMVFNRRYIKLYELDPEQITPGMSLRSLLECRAKTNTSSARRRNMPRCSAL